MNYGIEILNSHGEPVIDFNRSLYVTSSGQTVDYKAQADSAADALGLSRDFGVRHYLLSILLYEEDHVQYATPGGTAVTLGAEKGLLYPRPVGVPGDLVFLQISVAGVWFTYSVNNYFPEIPANDRGAFAAVHTEGDAPIQFLGAGVTPPSGPTAEQYGMQLRDAAGNITFDSRYPFISIFAHFVVSQSVIQNILINNATHDLTLPVSAPGCFVSVGSHASFREVFASGGYWTSNHVLIKQISSNTIRLSRYGPAPQTSDLRREFFQDLILICARNPL